MKKSYKAKSNKVISLFYILRMIECLKKGVFKHDLIQYFKFFLRGFLVKIHYICLFKTS